MELTQLRYFLAAANCGQIVKAAEMLHVSQSAVSMAVSRLEKELGVDLFKKQGRSIRLTENGELFVDMITPAMAELDFAQSQMLIADRQESDTIVLSVEMPDFATSFERIYYQINPKARFRQSMDSTEVTRQKLMCEKLDFTLSFEPFSVPDISSLLLLTEPVFIQLSAENPLSEKETLSLSELSETPFTSFSAEYSFRRWTDGMCFLAGFRPKTCYEVCDTQSLMSVVRSHNAAAFISRSTWEDNTGAADHPTLNDQFIKAIPLTDKHCQRTVYLSYHKNRILTTGARGFLDFAIQYAAAMERFKDMKSAKRWLLSQ